MKCHTFASLKFTFKSLSFRISTLEKKFFLLLKKGIGLGEGVLYYKGKRQGIFKAKNR